MTSVCVFCGSSSGRVPAYADTARRLGDAIARQNLRLVYGGGRVGLMGQVADAVLAGGGEVVGVIPQRLSHHEIAHPGLTELHVVESMHVRKAMMADFSDAFIALPGGFGTLDELCEILTWAQLGLHDKPIVLLDVDDYFASLMRFFDRAVADGFVRPRNRELIRYAADVEGALSLLRNRASSPA